VAAATAQPLQPIKPDGLTVSGDAAFLDMMKGERNLPAGMPTAMLGCARRGGRQVGAARVANAGPCGYAWSRVRIEDRTGLVTSVRCFFLLGADAWRLAKALAAAVVHESDEATTGDHRQRRGHAHDDAAVE